LLKKVLLLHDNASPHTASQTAETINHLGFEVLKHPAYSPDLAPSDYHLYGPLKNALRGRRFSTDKEVCRKRCINGCATNQKPSSWREYASLWTAEPSASKKKETM